MANPETFWPHILSRTPGRIRAAWIALGVEEQAAVFHHLKRMATEDDWTEPQRLSAQLALDTLNDYTPPGERPEKS